MFELSSLFFASLLVSTIFPGGVEPYVYLLYQQGHDFGLLLIVATAGNTLGGVITFLIGGLLFKSTRLHAYPKITRFFRVSDKWVSRLQKYGASLLLLSWMPIIGDPLVLAAGYLRFRFLPSVLAILVGKFFRYLVLLWLF